MVNWESILSSLFHQDRAKIFLSFNWGFLVCCHCHSQAVDFLSSKSGIFKEKSPGTHPYVVPWIPGSWTSFPFSLHLSYIHMCSVASNYMQLQGLYPTRLLYPWDCPSKNTGVGCRFLLHGIFLTQGLNVCLLWLLHCRQILYHWATWEALSFFLLLFIYNVQVWGCTSWEEWGKKPHLLNLPGSFSIISTLSLYLYWVIGRQHKSWIRTFVLLS